MRTTAVAAIGAGVALAVFCSATAQESASQSASNDPSGASQTQTNTAGSVDQNSHHPPPEARTPAERVSRDVTSMLQAGVSKEVVKAYIERLRIPYELSAADIIALKQKSVPDEVIAAMVNHAPPAQPLPGPERMRGLARRQGQGEMAGNRGLDPEGYDFWWYHYAYPRALASANERLLSSTAPYFQPGFGYYPYLHFAPQPPPRWAPRQ